LTFRNVATTFASHFQISSGAKAMGRIVLGVIVGFVVWSIVWIGSNALMEMLSPSWWGRHGESIRSAFADGSTPEHDNMISLVMLIRSIITSIIAGYITALVAGEYRRSTMAFGIILVLVAIVIEGLTWRMAPAWYHIAFVLLLYPMTVLGGRLRRAS
jgi:hypothetical protein